VPTVLRWNGYRFYFFSNEGNEPPHIHVDKDSSTAKFWLADGALSRSIGFDTKELRTLSAKVAEEREGLLEAWNGYFGR
jgi:5-enolpyruvylshikimate-3-phosphate synthase